MRILLAEDDTLLGDGLRAGLRQLGFQVDWVRDGEAAEVGVAEAHALLESLGVTPDRLLAGAYVDLLPARTPHGPRAAD